MLRRLTTTFLLLALPLVLPTASHAGTLYRVTIFQDTHRTFTDYKDNAADLNSDLLEAIAAQEKWQLQQDLCVRERCVAQLADAQITRELTNSGQLNLNLDKNHSDELGLIESTLTCCPPNLRFAANTDPLTSVLPRWLFNAFLAISGLLLTLVVVASVLRARVKTKTAELSTATIKLQEEIAERKRTMGLLTGQNQVLQMVASGAPLEETLTTLVRLIETLSPDMQGSILLLDEDGVHVRHGAAPSLPSAFVEAVEGQPIGPNAGSCGTAAWRKEVVYTEDIATDPLWEHYKAAALPHGLRACWSTPIFDEHHKVLGTFAMYHRQPGLPKPEHKTLIDISIDLAAIAIKRQQTQKTLRESGERLRLVMDGLGPNMFVGLLDAHGTLLLANRPALQAVGLELADVTGKPLQDTYWLSYSDAVRQRIVAAIKRAASGETVHYDEQLRISEDQLIWLDFNIHPLRDELGNITYLIPSGIVITQRKETEQKLRESEAKFRAIFESSPIAMTVNDQHQNIALLNNKFVETFGYALTDIPSVEDWWLLAYPDPDYRQYVKQHWKKTAAQALRDHTESEPVEYTVTGKDGRQHVTLFNMTAMNSSSLMTFHDITERKRSEIQLRQLNRFYITLSETNEAIVRANDADSLFQRVCDILTHSAGYHLAWVGKPTAESIKIIAAAGLAVGYLDETQISVDADRPDGMGATGRVYRSGKHYICNDFLQDPEALPWREKASKYGIRASIAFPLKKAGKITAILNVYSAEPGVFNEAEIKLLDAMAKNIAFSLEHLQQQSDLNHSMESLQQAKLELEERVRQRTVQLEIAKQLAENADKMKSVFLASMSHELRTPLNSIIGFTGVLLQKFPGPLNVEQVKQMTMVKNSSLHLLALINDILDIAKVEAGELKLEYESFDIVELLSKTADSFTAQATRRGLSLYREFHCENVEIKGDTRRVEQVISNLLSNAIKFTPHGRITLNCSHTESSILISVSDTGIGIRAEDLIKLFQPFSQIIDSSQGVREGTGLGLAISKELVEAMGGKIYAESVWGQGSRFSFTLIKGLNP